MIHRGKKTQVMRQRRLYLAVGLALMSGYGAAQTVGERRQDAQVEPKLETVVVTAQRREEALQKVPIAITTLSAKDLEDKQVRRLDDLKFEVPNMLVEANTGTSSAAKIFMRGIGTDESLFTADPAIAIYIDDVYIPRQTGAMLDLFDVQQVEVLRGPQGTLYGRNATGGAIRYVTVKPTGKERLDVDARLGDFGRQDFRINYGTRVADKLDLTLSAMSKSRDGYMTDVSNGGRKVNDEDVRGLRLGAGFWLLPNTRATLSFDRVEQRSGPSYATGVIDAAMAAKTGRPINDPDGNWMTLETNLRDGKNDLDQWGVSAVFHTELEGVEWRNIVAYRKMNNLLYVDLDASTATRFHLYQDQRQHQRSYESQLVSTGKGPLKWTAGLFLFSEYNRQPTRSDIFVTGPTNDISLDTSARALYGQLEYQLTPVWKATAGLRSSHERKDFSVVSTRPNGTPNFSADRDRSWKHTDWKLGLDAQLSPEILAYGTVATGFKSGGFNGRAATVAAITTVDAETVRAYELGLKTMLADGRVRLNIDYYRNQYDQLQLTAFDPNGVSLYLNAADTVIKGWEAEAAVQITARWTADFNLGTIDGKYVNYSAINKAIFDGRDLKQAPKLQWGLGTSYRYPVAGGVVAASAQVKYVGDHYQTLTNSAVIKTMAYTLVDARIGYEARNWSVGIWGKNLTNKHYIAGGFDLAGLGIADAYINPPRMVGVDMKYKFW
jgi:iron complex outermembrane receptor protein